MAVEKVRLLFYPVLIFIESCISLNSVLFLLPEVEQKVAPKSEVTASASGKKVGIVTTALGSRGLGLLRLEEAFKGSRCLSIQGHEDVKVEAVRPDWWPHEWFLEHEQSAAL